MVDTRALMRSLARNIPKIPLTPEQRRERNRLRSLRWRRAHGTGPRKPAERPWHQTDVRRHVMLIRYRGSLALKTWALDIARRSTMRKAWVALARRLAIIMFAMLKQGTKFEPA
jgi:hypothetical protein